nr:ORFc [Heliothis subflexa]
MVFIDLIAEPTLRQLPLKYLVNKLIGNYLEPKLVIEYMSYFRIAATSTYVLATNIIEQINESPGIHFEPTGTVKSSNEYLHVLVPNDIGYIKPHIDNIKTVLGTTRFFCQQNEVNISICQNILQPLVPRLDSIQNDYNAISHLITDKEKRSAWFAGIGSMFKQIIGTMDENDAIKYNNAILTLDNNNRKLASLFKDNVLITNTALQNFNETLKTIEINEARLNGVIESLVSGYNNISEINSKLRIESKINNIYNELFSSLLTLSFKVEDMINAIMFTKSHSIHPSVLTPKQLYYELVSNVRNLVNNKDLPISLSLNNIHAIIDIAQLSCYYLDNKIVFVIKIPLVYRMEYNLYKSIPVPIPHNNQHPDSYAMILPLCKYIAISRDKITYSCFSDLRDCIETINQIYICYNLDTYSVKNTPICETEMLCRIPDKLPQECKTKLIQGQLDIWQELKGNRWLFVESESVKLTVECQSQLSEYKLLGTGILHLQPGCKAFSNNKEFLTKQFNTITVKPIISDINLINDPCCDVNKLNIMKSKLNPVKLIDTNLEKLTVVANDQFMTDINKIINEPTPVIKYESHYPVITYCLCVILILFLLFICCKKFGKHLNLRKQSNITDSGIVPDDDQELEQVPAPRIRIAP